MYCMCKVESKFNKFLCCNTSILVPFHATPAWQIKHTCNSNRVMDIAVIVTICDNNCQDH